jgi:hypothetical protein
MTKLFPRTRLSRYVGALVMVLMLLKPSPAHAWFGWLDEWSGPGGWFGVFVDLRLVCFGPKLGLEGIGDQLDAAAVNLTRALARARANRPRSEYEAEFRAAVRSFNEALRRLEVAQTLAGVPAEDLDDVRKTRAALLQALKDFDSQLAAQESIPADDIKSRGAAAAQANKDDISTFTTVENALKAIGGNKNAYSERIISNIEIQVGTGVFISLCSADNVRRASVEINANQWFTRDNQYNNNNWMWFSTIAPSFTWKVASSAQRDFLDLGVSAGVYTVQSKHVDSIAGFVIEPIRADFHGPTAWHSSTNLWKRVASLVTFRLGLTMFPGGFEAGELKPTGPEANTGRIKPELIPTYGIFFRALR